MTPQQSQEILAKAAEVYTLRTAYLAAQEQHNNAITNAQNAQATWYAGVNAGASEATLASLLDQYVASDAAEEETRAAMQAANTPYNEAVAELNAMTKAVLEEPPPP